MIQHIRQKHAKGCVVACLAMITGIPYDEVASDFSGDRHADGLSEFSYEPWLAAQGYATQCLYRHVSAIHADRMMWPPPLFADVHLSCVQPPGGSHAVVVMRDGSVLDPARDTPSRLSEYGEILSIRGVWKVTERQDIGPLTYLHWSNGKGVCQWCGAQNYQYHDPCPARNKR